MLSMEEITILRKEQNETRQIVEDIVELLANHNKMIAGLQRSAIKQSRRTDWPLGTSAETDACFERDGTPVPLAMEYDEAPTVWRMAVEALRGEAAARFASSLGLAARMFKAWWERAEKARRQAEKKAQAALDYKNKIANLSGTGGPRQ